MKKRSSKSGAKKKYEVVDRYTQKAHQKGFAARSVFKLEEIQKRTQLYKGVKSLLDLGSSPGSWLQYASRFMNPSSVLVGVDIVPLNVSIPRLEFFQADLFKRDELFDQLESFAPFDLIQSDAMTKTTGIAEADCARSLELVESAVYMAQKGLLKSGGKFLAKIFEGPGFNEFWAQFKRDFKQSRVFRPEAIRKGSREIYVFGVLK